MKKKLVLASGSPRRQHMLAVNQIPFEVIVSNIDETPQLGEVGEDYVLRNANEKALAVATSLSDKCPILSADTIVLTKTGHILEKPNDAEHAKTMLQHLSNDYHRVLTGYALYEGQTQLITRCIETKVHFRFLSEEEIDGYIKTGEPFDKAGSYGIQGAAMGFVERIEGSYTNVMGLPLTQVLADLKHYFGMVPFSE